MIGFLIALLSGALMSIQGVFNTQVTKTTGMWVGNGWVRLLRFVLRCGFLPEEIRFHSLWKYSRNICC